MLKKITIIASCSVFILFSGCVSQDKYRQLESHHHSTQRQMKEKKNAIFKLRVQNEKLLYENQRLLKTNDVLKVELKSAKSTDTQTEKVLSKKAPSTDELSRPYSILVSSCQLQESVQKVLANYKEINLNPFVVKVDLGEKGVWWRIFIGHFESREIANDEKNKIGLPYKIVLKANHEDSMLAQDGENEVVNNTTLLVQKEH
jgi:outer membrane murein-binding lipoprotein Lpp